MGLDDTQTIDIILNPTRHAKVRLLIVDGEAHPDEQVRFDKFLNKLRAYIAHIIGSDFAVKHPGVGPEDVLIGVLCAQPPNEVMKQMQEVRPKAKPGVSIRVICVQYQKGDEIPWFIRPDGVAPA